MTTEGAGQAQDAAIKSQDEIESKAAVDQFMSDADYQVLVDNVDRAHGKVDQAKADLAAADEALAIAVAELEGV